MAAAFGRLPTAILEKVHEWFALHDRVATLRASRYYARTLAPFVASTMRLSAPSAQHCTAWPGVRRAVRHPDERDARCPDDRAAEAGVASDTSTLVRPTARKFEFRSVARRADERDARCPDDRTAETGVDRRDTKPLVRLATRRFEFALAYLVDMYAAELWYHRGREWTASLGARLVPQHLHTLVFDLSRDYWHQLSVDVGDFARFAFLRRFSYRDAQYMHSTARSRIAHALAGFAATLETLELECRGFAHDLLACELPTLVELRLAGTLVALPQTTSAPSLERLLARLCPHLQTLTLDDCLSPLPTSSEAPLCSVESVRGHAQHSLHFSDWTGARLPSSATLTELDCAIDVGSDWTGRSQPAWPRLTALTVRGAKLDANLLPNAPSLVHLRCVARAPAPVPDDVRANLVDVGDDDEGVGHCWRGTTIEHGAVTKVYRILRGE